MSSRLNPNRGNLHAQTLFLISPIAFSRAIGDFSVAVLFMVRPNLPIAIFKKIKVGGHHEKESYLPDHAPQNLEDRDNERKRGKSRCRRNRDFERIDKRDKRYRLRNSSLEAMTEQVGFDIADETPSPEESLINSEGKAELRAQVRSALSCLTEKQREVIVLHFWEELSLREIAKKKGVHHSSVEETFAVAMKKLEKFFKKS